MRYLVSVACMLAVVALPQGVSAKSSDEAKPPEPIRVAYIPEHLQRRMPQYRHKEPPSLEYKTETVPQTQEEREKERARTRRIAIGVSVSLVVAGTLIGLSAALSSGLKSMEVF